MCISDAMLHTINWHDTLLSNGYHRNHEVTRVKHSKEHGCYIVYNKRRGKMLGAGSVSSRIDHKDTEGSARGRIMCIWMKVRHLKIIFFYNCYPDENWTQANKTLKEVIFKT